METTPVIEEATTSRWKNPDFIRKYYREKRRQDRGGLKRHPNVLDDGRKWSEVHNTNKKSYYQPSPVETCMTCGKLFHSNRRDRHLKSDYHNIALEVLSFQRIINA